MDVSMQAQKRPICWASKDATKSCKQLQPKTEFQNMHNCARKPVEAYINCFACSLCCLLVEDAPYSGSEKLLRRPNGHEQSLFQQEKYPVHQHCSNL